MHRVRIRRRDVDVEFKHIEAMAMHAVKIKLPAHIYSIQKINCFFPTSNSIDIDRESFHAEEFVPNFNLFEFQHHSPFAQCHLMPLMHEKMHRKMQKSATECIGKMQKNAEKCILH